MTPILDLRGIHKSYGTIAVLQGVGLRVAKGECVVLIGPSGSGKSTLLRSINLLEPISSGSILFAGAEIAGLTQKGAAGVRRRIGMVFQQFELFQHLSAIDNVTLAPVQTGGCSPRCICPTRATTSRTNSRAASSSASRSRGRSRWSPT
jgi:polar amino acid transport system ATP-binding protein